MVIIPGDDTLLGHDDSLAANLPFVVLRSHCSSGSWELVAREHIEVLCIGRRMCVVDEKIRFSLPAFVAGRRNIIEIASPIKQGLSDAATANERSEYQSLVGNSHWLVYQLRLDRAIKHQEFPTAANLKVVNKIVIDSKQERRAPGASS